jgi:phage-related protein (TIGR01555 family)
MKKTTKTPTPKPVAKARVADSFQNVQARLGYGAGSQADGGDYSVNYLSRFRFRLEAMYRSSWICGKAVDLVAEDMTKRGIEINSTIDPGENDELMRLWKELQIWDAIADTIKWARLYGGAIAVMLIDGQNFSTPLRIETVKKDQFKGLLVLDRWQVQPTLQNLVQEMGPNMGLPMFYDVIADTLALKSAHIHYSRVIRIDGQDLPYWQRIGEQLWGQSILERLFDRLLAFDSTTQGAAQLVYKAHLRTYKIEALRDIIAMGGPALEGLLKQIEFIRSTQSNEGLTLMDTKDEFEAHAYSFAGLDSILLQLAQQVSGALGIPLTKLFGQSPAGLNATGESDIRNYYDSTNQEQERRLRVGVGVLLQITYLSKFGKAIDVGTDFTFRPLWQLTDLEKATMAATITTCVTTAVSGGLTGRQTGLKELRQSSHITGVWGNISDESIAAASDEPDLGEMGGGSDPFGAHSEDEGDEGKDAKTKDEALLAA